MRFHSSIPPSSSVDYFLPTQGHLTWTILTHLSLSLLLETLASSLHCIGTPKKPTKLPLRQHEARDNDAIRGWLGTKRYRS